MNTEYIALLERRRQQIEAMLIDVKATGDAMRALPEGAERAGLVQLNERSISLLLRSLAAVETELSGYKNGVRSALQFGTASTIVEAGNCSRA